MIQQLKKYWQEAGEILYTYSDLQLDKRKVNNETIAFFTSCGLPSEAAPFLSFSELQAHRLLSPNQIFKTNIVHVEDFLMFGGNGSGDPICIDTVNDNQIVYLNHDNYFERIFINTNILCFAISLTTYRDFIGSLKDNSPKDFSLRKFDDTEFRKLNKTFKEIDGLAITENSFWLAELNELLWERDNE